MEWANPTGPLPQYTATKTYVDALASKVLHLDGSKTMKGHLYMDTHGINNLVDPVESQDYATKACVDIVQFKKSRAYIII